MEENRGTGPNYRIVVTPKGVRNSVYGQARRRYIGFGVGLEALRSLLEIGFEPNYWNLIAF